MSQLTAIRLLDSDEPAGPLLEAVRDLAEGRFNKATYQVEPDSFRQVPNAPFAYWASKRIQNLFTNLSQLESDDRRVERGLFTGDDSRFIRIYWELPKLDNTAGQWGLLSKGGSFARYYYDVHLAVLCSEKFAEIHESVISKYTYLKGNSDWVLHPECSYSRPGLTYPLRTTSEFSVRCLPGGCFWTNKGISIFESAQIETDKESLFAMLALLNATAFRYLLSLLMAAGDAAARSYEEGIVAQIPWPSLDTSVSMKFVHLSKSAWSTKRNTDTANQTSHAFYAPALSPGQFGSRNKKATTP